MKDLARKGYVQLDKPTLNPTIRSVMKNESDFA